MKIRKKNQTIMIGGCPRSGTSWLQFLLASYPNALSTRETHLYDKYLGPMSEWFSREGILQGRDGLSGLFSEEEFEQKILAPIARRVWKRIQRGHPKSSVLIEKTPGNILHHRLIRKLQPDCKLLFIVRDPRSVVASYKAAGQEAWGGWAKKPVAEVCATWNVYSTAYTTARAVWPDEQLYFVRYEDLRTETVERLREIFKWVDLKCDITLLENIVAENEIANLRTAEQSDALRGDDRKGFYRKGECSGWVEDLTDGEIQEVERLCANFMDYWGYAHHDTDLSP